MSTKVATIIGTMTALIMGNLFVLFYVQESQLKRIEALQNQLVKTRQDLTAGKEDRKREREKRSEEQSHYWQLHQEMETVVARLPHVFSFTESAGSIAGMIGKHNLTTGEGLLFTPEKSDRLDLTRYTTNIVAKGRYGDLKAFIAELGSVPELLCIERIGFKRSGDASDLIELRLGISIYFRGDANG